VVQLASGVLACHKAQTAAFIILGHVQESPMDPLVRPAPAPPKWLMVFPFDFRVLLAPRVPLATQALEESR
jgi:hypothetical protein